MASQATELNDDEDVKVLLKGIFSELTKIGAHLARQGERIEQLQIDRQAMNLKLTRMEGIYMTVSSRSLVHFQISQVNSKHKARR